MLLSSMPDQASGCPRYRLAERKQRERWPPAMVPSLHRRSSTFLNLRRRRLRRPPNVQSDLAIRAAEAGKHLLLEKTVAAVVGHARRDHRDSKWESIGTGVVDVNVHRTGWVRNFVRAAEIGLTGRWAWMVRTPSAWHTRTLRGDPRGRAAMPVAPQGTSMFAATAARSSRHPR